MNWQPQSWQQQSLHQQTVYPDQSKLTRVMEQLQALPPLVTPLQVDRLKNLIKKASQGECFILQGGDCAETFADCNTQTITNKIKILLQLSLVLMHGLHKPVVRIGRIAGQYAKPRSEATETREGITLPSYRGDLINRPEFNEYARQPNPQAMLDGYSYASLTLNYIRALVESCFAELHKPEYWDLDFVQHSPQGQEYQALVENIRRSLHTYQLLNEKASLDRGDFFTCHEALHLPYEQALTRKKTDGSWYNLSTHLPWVGMRTANIDSAHIEYIRGIANPVAIKVGPKLAVNDLIALIERVNPSNEPGKLVLIHRLGNEQIAHCLPDFINAVKAADKNVLWCSDPMHGNTRVTKDGVKTRHFEDILSELEQAFAIHKKMDSILGGVHFELTGDNVTECIGGARGLTEEDLQHAYKSLVDPRLNYEQSLEMAMLIIRKAGTTKHE